MTLDEIADFKPEEYAEHIKKLRNNQPVLYNELHDCLQQIQKFDENQKLYTVRYYTLLERHKDTMKPTLVSMYEHIYKRLLEI